MIDLVHSGIESTAIDLHQHVQKNSVSLKEVLTLVAGDIVRIHRNNIDAHRKTNAQSTRVACKGICQECKLSAFFKDNCDAYDNTASDAVTLNESRGATKTRVRGL